MTRVAPSPDTSSAFPPLQTAVTSARLDVRRYFARRKFVLRTAAHRTSLAERAIRRPREQLPHFELEKESFESAYYDGLRILMESTAPCGESYPIADLGLFDWVGQLTANRRLRFVASGFGLQLLPSVFRAP